MLEYPGDTSFQNYPGTNNIPSPPPPYCVGKYLNLKTCGPFIEPSSLMTGERKQ